VWNRVLWAEVGKETFSVELQLTPHNVNAEKPWERIRRGTIRRYYHVHGVRYCNVLPSSDVYGMVVKAMQEHVKPYKIHEFLHEDILSKIDRAKLLNYPRSEPVFLDEVRKHGN
jgi:hypothetical protein